MTIQKLYELKRLLNEFIEETYNEPKIVIINDNIDSLLNDINLDISRTRLKYEGVKNNG